MKRNISDLLDTYLEEDLEPKTETPFSPQRIKERTMNQISVKQNNGKKTGRLRAPVRALAVAAVVAAMSITALAADIGGVSTRLQSYFAKDGDGLSSGQIQVINQLGATFSGGVTSEGATITPVEAIADENVYYLHLRMEAPEGVTLPDLDEDTEGFYQFFGETAQESLDLDLSAYGGEYPPNYWVDYTWLPDPDPTDNVKEAVMRYQVPDEDGEEITPLKFNDGVSKVLTIRGLWMQTPDKVYTKQFGGTFVFDIGQNFESKVVDLDCEGLSYYNDAIDVTNTLDTLTLSPLSLSCQYKCTLLDNQWIRSGPGPFKVVLKDGTVFYDDMESMEDSPRTEDQVSSIVSDIPIADLPRSEKPSTVHRLSIPFDEPLDLSQVDYVEYGGEKIPVNVQ